MEEAEAPELSAPDLQPAPPMSPITARSAADGGVGAEEAGSPHSPADGGIAKPAPPKSTGELSAAHQAGSMGGRMFNLMLPTISKARQVKAENPEVGEANDDDTVGSSTTGTQINFPVIPPRGMSEIFKLPDDPAQEESWFRVLTPREIKGIDGPYSEQELREMYKTGQLKDTTLMWREGERDWKQLLFLKELRPRLLPMPSVPPRIGGDDDAFADRKDDEDEDDAKGDKATLEEKRKKEAAAYNPIVKLPTGNEIENIAPLYSIPLTNLCTRCGAFAVGHLAGVGRNEVDMVSLRRMRDFPKDLVSEVIPGLVYIGHSGAAKLNTLLDMNISLIINCTNNMANPPDRVPYYRGKVVPLKDKPKSDRPSNMQAMIELLDKVCDWMENERQQPERAALSDPVPEPLKLKRQTDKYGRPLRSAEEIGMKRRAGMDGNKKPPPRILLWSRKGLDRPCFVAAAYLVRQYGMDVERAINVVETARPGAALSRAYRAALDEFGKKHTKGELLCSDCITNARLTATLGQTAEDAAAAAGAGPEEASSSVGKPRRAKHEPCYSKFATSMDQQRKAFATAHPGEYDPAAALGDPNTFLLRVMNGRVLESGWANLLDLQLVSRRLGDATMGAVFSALAQTGCLVHLRAVSIKGNDLTCSGVTAVLDLLQPGSPELTALNLSCNKAQLEGANRISAFVLDNASITTLDVSSNPLGDEGVAALFQCITMPRSEFDVEKADEGDTGGGPVYNRTITNLDVGATELGHEAGAALINVFRDNMTLTSLSLDFNVEFGAKDMKHVFNSLRAYNKTLERLSLANTPISSKSMGYLARVFENVDLPLKRLDLSFCTLASTHVGYLSKSIHHARFLTHLVLNSNDLGDVGAEYLAKAIEGQVDDRTGERWPPLKHVDCSFCSIEEEGCRLIVAAMATRPSITSANLSYNKMGDQVFESGVVESLSRCRLSELRLNGCQLQSRGGTAILELLCTTEARSPRKLHHLHQQHQEPVINLCSELRELHLADNGMHDSTAEAVSRLVNNNLRIEVLDLGYNLFSEACADAMSSAKRVPSTAPTEKKVLSLSINMVGNNCDPYMLDAPGMARSKTAFRFGVKPSVDDPINGGFTHVPESSRDLHRIRLVDSERAQAKLGRFQLPINQLSL